MTLRADFYDKPLLYQGFGELLATRTYAVTPLSVAELERAVTGPAEAVGVEVEPRLIAEVVAEVADRPGTLPLLQYALTELFETRENSSLSLASYHRLGGVSGALARRAEALFGKLDEAGKDATRQLFLRLVGSGEGAPDDTRRRVLRSELSSLEVDRDAMESAIDSFGARRLLSFDRDPVTRGPTVEVAHETLLREWGRLRGWIESSREDLHLHARLTAAASEWLESGQSADYLLTGSRLSQIAEGTRTSSVKLTDSEREFLKGSLARAEAERNAEAERRAREVRLERRAVIRLRALVGILAAASLIAASLTVVALNRSREAERQRAAALLGEQRQAADRLTAGSVASLETDPALSMLLSLHAIDIFVTLGERVPATTVEALHWALQEAGVEYPIEDESVVVASAPRGRRGVFDLPLAELANLARANVQRSLTPEECEQFLGTATCPGLPTKFSEDLDAERIGGAVPVASEGSLAGTEVSVMAVAFGWDEDYRAELNRVGNAAGIAVSYEPLVDFEDKVMARARAGDPPDIALFPQPGLVADMAREGHVIDLGTYLDVNQLRQDISPYLVSLGTVADDGTWPSGNGSLYGVMEKVRVKSLVWYPVPEFRRAGYSVPQNWRELVALSEQLRADGRTPWCMGLESGTADGWPATDWIENLVLRAAGPKFYDRWTSHEVPFTHPAIKRAFVRMGRIVFEDGFLHHGIPGALNTTFDTAQHPMVVANAPECWLYSYPSFGTISIPPGSIGKKTDIFPFPAPNLQHRNAVMAGGEMVAVFSDRPEVREVVKGILSPQFGSTGPLEKHGYISANRRFDRSGLHPFWKRQAKMVDAALAANTFRFDGSDLMPPEVGLSPFFNAMIEYLREGPESLDGILKDLEASWPEES